MVSVAARDQRRLRLKRLILKIDTGDAPMNNKLDRGVQDSRRVARVQTLPDADRSRERIRTVKSRLMARCAADVTINCQLRIEEQHSSKPSGPAGRARRKCSPRIRAYRLRCLRQFYGARPRRSDRSAQQDGSTGSGAANNSSPTFGFGCALTYLLKSP